MNVENMKKCFTRAFQVVHFVIAMGFLWAGIVEFIDNPPFFDAYGDAVAATNWLPKTFFDNDPRENNREQILRLMDIPMLFMLLAYFAECLWLRFQDLSWLLSFCMAVNLIFFFVINFWAAEFFDWRYYSDRLNGLLLQTLSISVTVTCLLMTVFWKRKRMPFKFKSSLRIRSLGKTTVIWNFISILVIVFFCLLIWYSRLYISWACFRSHSEVMLLCQRTNQVQCYPCIRCDAHAVQKCMQERHNHTMFHCESPIKEIEKRRGALCLFNYNMSFYTFITVFAYVGGLCVFLSNFIRISVHYMFRGIFLLWHLSFVQVQNLHVRFRRQVRVDQYDEFTDCCTIEHADLDEQQGSQELLSVDETSEENNNSSHENLVEVGGNVHYSVDSDREDSDFGAVLIN